MRELEQSIKQLRQDFFEQLHKANSLEKIEAVRLHFLSRQGMVATLMQGLKNLPQDEKRQAGALLNGCKQELEVAFAEHKKMFEPQVEQQVNVDVTAYTPGFSTGHLHPYTYVIEKIEDLFLSMGYEIADGPEVETDKYNFQALNIPADHPARDMQDTFWLTLPNLLLRTQTSNVQIHTMEDRKPPLALIAPGRVYRNEATDASHDAVFMQVEGLFVAQEASLSNLFATLQACFRALFERDDIDIRLRPGFFPFVEPGVEVDMRCPFCTTGCSVCKQTRWIEIAGAGLVHPNVLSYCGIDATQYSGFAFGMGLTRLVMLKYGINDIRLLSSARLDFLKQF